MSMGKNLLGDVKSTKERGQIIVQPLVGGMCVELQYSPQDMTSHQKAVGTESWERKPVGAMTSDIKEQKEQHVWRQIEKTANQHYWDLEKVCLYRTDFYCNTWEFLKGSRVILTWVIGEIFKRFGT